MQNEKKNSRFAGKGYYIALIACIAAVGISGYVFVQTARQSAVETMAPVPSPAISAEGNKTAAAAPAVSAAPSEKPKTKTSGTAKQASPSQTPAASETASQVPDLMEDAYEPAMAETPVVMWPIQGEVMATFSRDTLTYSQTMADWRTHEGLDIAAEAGALVSATQDGTITAVYEDDYLGNVVVVSHSGDLATLYANLTEEPSVSVGDKVLAGEVLGQVGNSALLETAEPSHLHFEVYENGTPVDPISYLP